MARWHHFLTVRAGQTEETPVTATASTRTPQAPPTSPSGNWLKQSSFSRSPRVVAELGVADHVVDGPVPAEDLAAACGADPDALKRVLPSAGGTRDLRGRLRGLSPHDLVVAPASVTTLCRCGRSLALTVSQSFSATFADLEHRHQQHDVAGNAPAGPLPSAAQASAERRTDSSVQDGGERRPKRERKTR